jgi:hypothetical protein
MSTLIIRPCISVIVEIDLFLCFDHFDSFFICWLTSQPRQLEMENLGCVGADPLASCLAGRVRCGHAVSWPVVSDKWSKGLFYCASAQIVEVSETCDFLSRLLATNLLRSRFYRSYFGG